MRLRGGTAATSTVCRRCRSWAAAADIWIWARPSPGASPAAGPLRSERGHCRRHYRLSDCCCAAATVAVAGTSDSCPANSPTGCRVWAFPFPGQRAPSAGYPSGCGWWWWTGCRCRRFRTASPVTAQPARPLGSGAVSIWTWTSGVVPANGLLTRPTPTAWTCRFSLQKPPQTRRYYLLKYYTYLYRGLRWIGSIIGTRRGIRVRSGPISGVTLKFGLAI